MFMFWRKIKKITIGDKSKHIRKTLNLTQKDLATLVGTNQSFICLLERGFVPIDQKKNIINKIEKLYKEIP